MSETQNQYPTGVYVKGDDERVANTPARAVALAFEGYKLKSDESAEEAPEVTETPAVVEPKPDAPVEVADADKAPRVNARPAPPKKD